jgi:hypothetical protein
VRDTGPGIAPEHIENVFRPFWQVEANKQGIGLGLAIARGIAEAHGGEIGVERSGPGATFVFSIPCGGVPSTTASLPPLPAGEPLSVEETPSTSASSAKAPNPPRPAR